MPGLYGTVRTCDINVENDVEILYFYRPTRGTEPDNMTGFKSLSSNYLIPSQYDEDEPQASTNTHNILGLYELRLPMDVFGQKGFYTVYIRPKEISTTLTDVSVLASYPDVKGVVFNLGSGELSGINDLTGYRIDYLDKNGNRTDVSRIITSCNRCEPILVTIADAYPKATRYKLTDSTASNLVFCTVTPSAASSFKPNATPFIGIPGDSVFVVNTKFDPKLIEIEMVDHDADTLTYMIEGDQVRNRDKAIITTYNDEHEIYKQQDYYTVKDKLGNALYDVKRNRDGIDNEESYDNTIDNI